MVKLIQVATLISIVVLSVLALAPLLGVKIPDSVWGLAVGSIAAITGNAIANSVEKFEFKQPKEYAAEIEIKTKQEKK